MHIKIICAWCQKFMGTKDAEGLDADAPRISHSICPACADLTNVQHRYEMVERYYERNRQLMAACDIVHAFISQAAGLTGGTKFEVQYAMRLGKEIFLHWENSIVQRTCQKTLPFGSEVNDLATGWLNFFSEALG